MGEFLMRMSYRAGVHWIAHNDEPGEFDVDVVAGLISVVMLADLSGHPAETIARAVIRVRKAAGIEPRRSPWEQTTA